MTNIKDKAFMDTECTCDCGNKHEVYGGEGYTGIECVAISGGLSGNGYYRNVAKCNKCGKIHTLQIVD